MSQTRNIFEKVHFALLAGQAFHLNTREAQNKLQTLVSPGEPVLYFSQDISTCAEIRFCCELAEAAGDYLQHIGVSRMQTLYGAEGLMSGGKSVLNMLLLLRAEHLNNLPEDNRREAIQAYEQLLFKKYRDYLADVVQCNDLQERCAAMSAKNPHIHAYSLARPPGLPMSDVLHKQRYHFPHFFSREKLFTPLNVYKEINPIVDVIFHDFTLHYFTTEEGKAACQKMLELFAEKFANSAPLQEIHSALAAKYAQPLFALIKAKCLTRALLANQTVTLSEDEKALCDFLMSFARDDTPNPKPVPNPQGYPVQISLPEVRDAMNAYFASKYIALGNMQQIVEAPRHTP